MSEKRKFSERAGDFLTGTSINGGAVAVMYGLFTSYFVAPMKMHQQVDSHVSPGTADWPGRDPKEINLEQAHDQAWARMTNHEDTYRPGDMHGSDLAGEHIDGSTEYILGQYSVGLGFLVWSVAMLYRYNYKK